MRTNRVPVPRLPAALAEVEASDTQYHQGQIQQTRRRTLALRIKPLGLWLVVALSLSPAIWTVVGGAVRAGLKWLLLGLAG